MSTDRLLAEHYTHGALGEAIDRTLSAMGKDPQAPSVDDLAPIDEFHTGGRPATLGLFEQCGFAPGMHILDIGSGLGGPARICANICGAQVTGIDLTPEYVETAIELSRRTGFAGRTGFRQASALELPFDAGAFDGAYLLHVGMNIADKARLFREIRRLLRPGAVFGIYDIMRLAAGEPTYPLPWASQPETSHVVTPAEYREALQGAGFRIRQERDRRAFVQETLARQAQREANTPPVEPSYRGPDFSRKVANLRAMMASGVFAPIEIVAEAI